MSYSLLLSILLAVPTDRPNIVFIMADDLGYGDLGCYGCPDISTPHLDRLAKEGVRMTDFYSNGSVCSPTRAAFMTGRYQQRIGLDYALYYGKHGVGLPPDGETIAHRLRAAGYFTAMSGKWHLGYDENRAPNHQGFERFFGLLGGNHHYFEHYDRIGQPDLYLDTKPVKMEGYSTDLITQFALKFMAANRNRPFFLYVPYNAPHFPFQGPDDANRVVTPKKGWQTGTRRKYGAMVESLDTNVGRILRALDQRGLATTTLVVFTSDNGGMFPLSCNAPLAKEKGTLWEGGIRVPCIARWPDRLPAGAISNQVAITMDWSATFLKLAGVEPSNDRPPDGTDLLALLIGKQPRQERTLFWRRALDPCRPGVRVHRAVRKGDWKYIDEPSGEQYLYDLSEDIGEKRNLAAQRPGRAAAMRLLLDQWEARVSSPNPE